MDFIARNRIFLSLLFIILFSTTNLARKSDVEFSFEGILVVTISPFQKLFHGTYKIVGQLWAGITELNYLREELDKTRQKLQSYEEVAQSLKEIKKENEELRKLLGYRERLPYKAIPAEIIAKNPDNFFRVFIVNKGSSSGIKKFMPVVSYSNGEKAVVGKIIEVRWNVSLVQPIIDSMSRIGVLLDQTRYVGLMSGHAPLDQKLRIDYISMNAAFKAGESVLTSGDGGIFPKGLLVGKVESLTENRSAGYKQAIVTPAIDFGNLDQVLIIQKEVDKDAILIRPDKEPAR